MKGTIFLAAALWLANAPWPGQQLRWDAAPTAEQVQYYVTSIVFTHGGSRSETLVKSWEPRIVLVLTPGKYEFKVWAINAAGSSGPSETLSVTVN